MENSSLLQMKMLKENGLFSASILQIFHLFAQLNSVTFKSNMKHLNLLDVEVYSVSTDTHFVHKAWHDDSDVVGTITYPMIGDPSHLISQGF